MIKETIVVEGKDDITNIKSAVDCELIATNGLAFGKDLIEKLKKIDKRCGIIIFTDPDFAGKKIRAKISKEIPNAKHAYLDRKKAIKKGDLGVENASKEDMPFLSDPSGINLAKTATQYSDGIIMAADRINPEIVDYCKELSLPMLEYDKASIEDGSYIDGYNDFYDRL